jgi:hypothetical protein
MIRFAVREKLILSLMVPLFLAAASCYDSAEKDMHVTRFPVSDPGELKSIDSPVIDRDVTSDGNGSLLVETDSPVSAVLYKLDGAGMEHARAAYKAMLRTEDLTPVDGSRGIAYLELKVVYPGGKEVVSRGPAVPPTGTTGWTPAETVVYADKGVAPESVTLSLVVDGKGKVWIDDVMLVTQPLRLDYLFWGHAVVWIVLIIYIYYLLDKQKRLRLELQALGRNT